MGILSILLFNDENDFILSNELIGYIKQKSERTIFLYYGYDKIESIANESILIPNLLFSEINKLLKSNMDKDIFLLDLAIKPVTEDFMEKFIQESRKEKAILTGTLLFNYKQNLRENNFIYSLGTNLLYRLGYFNVNARTGFGSAEVLLEKTENKIIDSIDYLFMLIPSGVLRTGSFFEETFPFYMIKSIVIDAFCFSNSLNGVNIKLLPKVIGKISYQEIGYIFPEKLQKAYINFWQNRFEFDISNPDYVKIRELYSYANICKRITDGLKCEINENAFVDILIVTMNNGRRLECTLRKIIESSYKNINIHVFNNASTDSTANILAEFSQKYNNVYIFNAPVNIGIPAALNWLFVNSSAPLVLRLDDDVSVEYSTIEDLIETLKFSPYAGISSPKIICINSQGKNIQYAGVYRINEELPGEKFNDACFTRIAGGPILMYKREVINRIGLWDIQYSPAQIEDIEHAFRVFVSGYDIIYNKKILAQHLDKGEEYISLHKVNRGNVMMKLFKDIYGVTEQEFNRFV